VIRIGPEIAVLVFLGSALCSCVPGLEDSFRVVPPTSAVGVRDEEHNVSQLNLLRDENVSAAAFESIVPVLRHPRCINCDSHGDSPQTRR
jgi:hypothetical protein